VAFRIGVALGWALTAYGIWVVIAHAREADPWSMALFLFGGLLVHDLAVAPATIGVASLLRSRLPASVRGAAAGAAMTSVLAVAVVVPAAIGRGSKLAGNPTIVPRDPWASAAIVVACTWVVAAAVVARRRRGRRTRAGARP
jgi:hypothetical protein